MKKLIWLFLIIFAWSMYSSTLLHLQKKISLLLNLKGVDALRIYSKDFFIMENKTDTSLQLHYEKHTISCPLEDGVRMIPVKTICKIIDVQFKNQDSWLKKHPFFSQLYLLAGVVGADNKRRKMNCLPLLAVNTWVASISETHRKQESIDKQNALIAFLYHETNRLHKSIDVFMQENKYELELIELKESLNEQITEVKQTMKRLQEEEKKVNQTLKDIRVNRFTGQTALQFPEKD